MTLSRVDDVATLRATISRWRAAGERIAFVPTMGNLHAGHQSLVTLARTHASRVVASVFVNPTQFGPNEDYARYPRTIDADTAALDAVGCDLLFAPSVDAMYPYGTDGATRIDVPGITDVLDGAARPGHFAGVATVVTRLFHMVGADVAVFGQKDYQQLLVIRRLVRDLALPIEIVMAPIAREPNGLAMSSRNQYLTPDERARAGVIHRTLLAMADAFTSGRSSARQAEDDALAALRAAGSLPDYATIRRADDLGEGIDATPGTRVALIATRLGAARLIDNLLF